MTSYPAPMCLRCARLDPKRWPHCEAFGEKPIPWDILLSQHDHREPFEGDNGILFEELKARAIEGSL